MQWRALGKRRDALSPVRAGFARAAIRGRYLSRAAQQSTPTRRSDRVRFFGDCGHRRFELC